MKQFFALTEINNCHSHLSYQFWYTYFWYSFDIYFLYQLRWAYLLWLYFSIRSQSCLPRFLVTYHVFSDNALILVLLSTSTWKTYYWSSAFLEITLVRSSIHRSSSSFSLTNRIFFQNSKISGFHSFVLIAYTPSWKSKFAGVFQRLFPKKGI